MTGPDPDGSGPLAAAATAYAFDLTGNLTSATDPVGRVSASAYDAVNRLTQTSIGDNYVVDYEYDAASQLVAMAGPAADFANNPTNRLETFYTYNARGQRASISDNTGRLQTFDYNWAGECIGFT